MHHQPQCNGMKSRMPGNYPVEPNPWSCPIHKKPWTAKPKSLTIVYHPYLCVPVLGASIFTTKQWPAFYRFWASTASETENVSWWMIWDDLSHRQNLDKTNAFHKHLSFNYIVWVRDISICALLKTRWATELQRITGIQAGTIADLEGAWRKKQLFMANYAAYPLIHAYHIWKMSSKNHPTTNHFHVSTFMVLAGHSCTLFPDSLQQSLDPRRTWEKKNRNEPRGASHRNAICSFCRQKHQDQLWKKWPKVCTLEKKKKTNWVWKTPLYMEIES